MGNIQEIKQFRYDEDIATDFGLKACRLVHYFECALHGKYTRGRRTDAEAWTYDSARDICQRVGLVPKTFERIVDQLEGAKLIKVKSGGLRNVRSYAFRDPSAYYKARPCKHAEFAADDAENHDAEPKDVRHVYALRSDVIRHGDAAAILLANFRYWQLQNGSAPERLFQGRYWRYFIFNDLSTNLRGFLSARQIKLALDLLDTDVRREKRLGRLMRIPYFNKLGKQVPGRYWVTLLEFETVNASNPDNHVRPEWLFDRDGKPLTDAQPEADILTKLDSEQNDQTVEFLTKLDTHNGHTARQNGQTGNSLENVTIKCFECVSDGCFPDASPTLTSTEDRVASLPSQKPSQRDKPSGVPPAGRPSASGSPSAHPPAVGTTGDVGVNPFGVKDSEQLALDKAFLRKQVPSLTTKNTDLAQPLSGQPDEFGKKPRLQNLLVRLPKQKHPNFISQFQQDKQIQAASGTDRDDKIRIHNEQHQIKIGLVPRECFGSNHGDLHRNCKTCPWTASCAILTPEEVQTANHTLTRLKLEIIDPDAELDTVQSVPTTYRDCYQLVYGESPPDTVGHASELLQNAKTLRLSVRLFLLTCMHLYSEVHGGKAFYARFADGHTGLERVKIAVDQCRKQFACATEIHLAIVLRLVGPDKKADWRLVSKPVYDDDSGEVVGGSNIPAVPAGDAPNDLSLRAEPVEPVPPPSGRPHTRESAIQCSDLDQGFKKYLLKCPAISGSVEIDYDSYDAFCARHKTQPLNFKRFDKVYGEALRHGLVVSTQPAQNSRLPNKFSPVVADEFSVEDFQAAALRPRSRRGAPEAANGVLGGLAR